MMGYASYLVWQNGAPHLPLTLYGIQLVMNLAWSPIFFKAKEIGYSLLDQVGEEQGIEFCAVPMVHIINVLVLTLTALGSLA